MSNKNFNLVCILLCIVNIVAIVFCLKNGHKSNSKLKRIQSKLNTIKDDLNNITDELEDLTDELNQEVKTKKIEDKSEIDINADAIADIDSVEETSIEEEE